MDARGSQEHAPPNANTAAARQSTAGIKYDERKALSTMARCGFTRLRVNKRGLVVVVVVVVEGAE